jgi:hypothetical protein
MIISSRVGHQPSPSPTPLLSLSHGRASLSGVFPCTLLSAELQPWRTPCFSLPLLLSPAARSSSSCSSLARPTCPAPRACSPWRWPPRSSLPRSCSAPISLCSVRARPYPLAQIRRSAPSFSTPSTRTQRARRGRGPLPMPSSRFPLPQCLASSELTPDLCFFLAVVPGSRARSSSLCTRPAPCCRELQLGFSLARPCPCRAGFSDPGVVVSVDHIGCAAEAWWARWSRTGRLSISYLPRIAPRRPITVARRGTLVFDVNSRLSPTFVSPALMLVPT